MNPRFMCLDSGYGFWYLQIGGGTLICAL